MVEYRCSVCGSIHSNFEDAKSCEGKGIEDEYPIPLGSVFSDKDGFLNVFYDSRINIRNPHKRDYVVARTSEKNLYFNWPIAPEAVFSFDEIKQALPVDDKQFTFFAKKLDNSLGEKSKGEPWHVSKLRKLELVLYK